MNRRQALKVIALGSSSLSALASAQGTPPFTTKIASLERLTTEWQSAEFFWDGAPALVLRVPKPEAAAFESGHTLEAGQGIFLTAYTLNCTHSGCKVALPNADHELECPCHGSVFYARDGSLKDGPARKPLKALKLELRGADVWAVGVL